MEFWEPELLPSIVPDAEILMAMDDFTMKFWKIGFVRVRVEIDSSEPIKLGVFIQDK